MTPFQAYQIYHSLKRHFSSWSYDCFKYNFKTNASMQAFNKRNDKFWFQKLARHEDPVNLIVSNTMAGTFQWVRDLLSEESEATYKAWLSRQQSLSYIFKTDCLKLEENFNDYFTVTNGQWPKLYKLYKQGSISPETLLIVDNIVKFLPYWKSNIKDETIWPTDCMKLIKYKPFITYDEKKVRKILLDSVNEYK